MRLISISDNKVFFVLFAEVLRIKSDLTTAKQLSRLEIGLLFFGPSTRLVHLFKGSDIFRERLLRGL